MQQSHTAQGERKLGFHKGLTEYALGLFLAVLYVYFFSIPIFQKNIGNIDFPSQKTKQYPQSKYSDIPQIAETKTRRDRTTDENFMSFWYSNESQMTLEKVLKIQRKMHQWEKKTNKHWYEHPMFEQLMSELDVAVLSDFPWYQIDWGYMYSYTRWEKTGICFSYIVVDHPELFHGLSETMKDYKKYRSPFPCDMKYRDDEVSKAHQFIALVYNLNKSFEEKKDFPKTTNIGTQKPIDDGSVTRLINIGGQDYTVHYTKEKLEEISKLYYKIGTKETEGK